MGDLQVGETYRDKVHIIETATGNPFLGQVPTVVVVDESENHAAPGNATESSAGDYYFDVTPDAAGTWKTKWACVGGTFVDNYIHSFKVGGGEVTDIKAETALIKAKTDLIPSDPAETSDVTTAHSTTNGLVTTVDTVVDAIKLKTDTIPSDPAETSDIAAAHATTDGLVTTVDTVVDAVKLKTDLIGASVALESGGNLATVVADTPYLADAALPGTPTAGSIGAIVKTNLDVASSTLATAANLAVVDGFHDVPTADATTDTVIRDVVGRKTDTANATVGTQSSIMRYIKAILNSTNRAVCFMDFWSDNDDDITLTTTATADFNLPNIVVADLPTGCTVIRVIAMLKVAMFRDTSTADNAVNGATTLGVDADSGYGSLVTAINIPDNSWAVDVSTSPDRAGDVMIGDNDVASEVTGNATFYGQLTNIACDGNNLLMKDVAWGLRVYFSL